MSLKELQELVASGSEDILKKLGYYSRVVKGSPSYWHTERKKMKALSRHIIHRSMEKEQMHIFQTFSPGKKICKKLYLEIPTNEIDFFHPHLADMHWDFFHQLIPEAHDLYLNKKVKSV